MGIKFNKSHIVEKCNAYFSSPAGLKNIEEIGQKKISGSTRSGSGGTNVCSPDDLADKLVSVLRKAMENSGLSENAMNSIGDISYSVHKLSDGKYMITVYFTGDLTRPSLQPEKYGHIDDIVLLFNNGVDHAMRPIKGKWHGEEIYNRTVIPGLHFLEQAIIDFKGNYGSECNIVDIHIEE